MGEFKRQGGFGGGNRGGFNKGGGRPNFGGKPSFNRGGGFGGDRGGDREMFTTTCATCSKSCQVPFRPSGERPVYCSDCFRNTREGAPRDFNAAPKRDFAPAPHAQQSAPVADKRIDELKRDVQMISAKLDTIMKMLGGQSAPVVTPKPVEKKVEAAPAKPVVAAKKAEKKVVAKKKAAPKK